MVWSKVLPPVAGQAESRVAVFLMNNDNTSLNVSASLAGMRGLGACGASGCSVRSIWEKRDLAAAHEVFAVLAAHDSALFVVGSRTKPIPPAPTPTPAPAPMP